MTTNVGSGLLQGQWRDVPGLSKLAFVCMRRISRKDHSGDLKWPYLTSYTDWLISDLIPKKSEKSKFSKNTFFHFREIPKKNSKLIVELSSLKNFHSQNQNFLPNLMKKSFLKIFIFKSNKFWNLFLQFLEKYFSRSFFILNSLSKIFFGFLRDQVWNRTFLRYFMVCSNGFGLFSFQAMQVRREMFFMWRKWLLL